MGGPSESSVKADGPIHRRAEEESRHVRTVSTQYKKRLPEWLWDRYLHRGVLNILTGGPGAGKSTICCEIAARLSKAEPLPGETEEIAKKRGVVRTWMFNAEDDPEDTIIWRLENQGADPNQISITSGGPPIDAKAARWIAREVVEGGIGLLTIDPVQAWIGAETDMYRPNHIRAWGNLLREVCLETGVTVLLVRHRRKGDADDHNSINSGLGSIDFSGIVRSELGAITTKRGAKITRIKGNVGPINTSQMYEIRDTGDPTNPHGQLFWSGEPVKELAKVGPMEKISQLEGYLVRKLMDGPIEKNLLIQAVERDLGRKRTVVLEVLRRIGVNERRGDLSFWRMKTPADGDTPIFDSTDSAN